jgi:tRNA 2-thiouridine synthesizing protein A
MTVDQVLDARGSSFPWCCLKAMSMLRKMKPGEILEVLGTDPLTLEDLPLILKQSEDELIKVNEDKNFFRLYLRRGRKR